MHTPERAELIPRVGTELAEREQVWWRCIGKRQDRVHQLTCLIQQIVDICPQSLVRGGREMLVDDVVA